MLALGTARPFRVVGRWHLAVVTFLRNLNNKVFDSEAAEGDDAGGQSGR
jgi:hypothetical protein